MVLVGILMQHSVTYGHTKTGEVEDPETGVSHLAHAICCIMFMLDLDEGEFEE